MFLADKYLKECTLTVDPNTFKTIDLNQLQVGMLLDRALAVYLAKNDRYVLVAHEFYPLEERVLEKIKKCGAAFASGLTAEARYPLLAQAVEKIRIDCSNDELAPYEKSSLVRGATEWLVPLLLPSDLAKQRSPDCAAAVFVIHRLLGAPPALTLSYVADRSLELYLDSLRTACVAGLFALWIGYTELEVLNRFVCSVFCAEVGILSDNLSSSQIKKLLGHSAELTDGEANKLQLRATKTIDLIRSGTVPGAAGIDHRLAQILGFVTSNSMTASDELAQCVAAARWLVRLDGWSKEFTPPMTNTAFRKVLVAIGRSFDEQEAAA